MRTQTIFREALFLLCGDQLDSARPVASQFCSRGVRAAEIVCVYVRMLSHGHFLFPFCRLRADSLDQFLPLCRHLAIENE
jgi:hypothetical protein